jgi:uncharacterized membrane protein YphA (DoxX/SURF4 family)
MNRTILSFKAIVAWLLAAFFLLGAYGNIFLSPDNASAYARWGYPDWFHYLTAFLELGAALLLIGYRTRLYGAVLGAVVMAAATLTTLIHGDYDHSTAPIIVFAVSLLVTVLNMPARNKTD